MLYHDMSCYVMLYHVISCYMSCHVMSCHVISCHVMLCHVMCWNDVSCLILLWKSTLFYDMLRYVRYWIEMHCSPAPSLYFFGRICACIPASPSPFPANHPCSQYACLSFPACSGWWWLTYWSWWGTDKWLSPPAWSLSALVTSPLLLKRRWSVWYEGCHLAAAAL